MSIWRKVPVPKAVISVFIIVYVSTVWCWLQPNTIWKNDVLTATKPVVMFFGLYQNYQVFAPSVRSTNAYIDAEVYYPDGRIIMWQYPRMETLGIIDRMVKERYRKLGLDYIVWPENKKLWPDLARYVARSCTIDGATPVRIKLRRNISNVAPASEKLALDATPEVKTVEFFDYQVQPADLR